jgi:hypothetical protein
MQKISIGYACNTCHEMTLWCYTARVSGKEQEMDKEKLQFTTTIVTTTTGLRFTKHFFDNHQRTTC